VFYGAAKFALMFYADAAFSVGHNLCLRIQKPLQNFNVVVINGFYIVSAKKTAFFYHNF